MITRSTRLVAGGIVLAVAIALGAGIIGDADRTSTKDAIEILPVIALDVPAEASAGEPLSVAMVTGPGEGIVPVVVRVGAWTHRFTVPAAEGRARLRLDGTLVGQAGVLEIRTPSVRATVELLPGPPVEGFEVLAGPHTVVADGADRAVAVVIVRDRLGNPVAEGTTVDFEWEQPGGAIGRGSADVDRLLAHMTVPSGIREGTSWIDAAAGLVRGVPTRIVEVPGPASTVEVAPLVFERTEVGEAIVLQSEVITDRFDNPLPDGVEGHFRIETGTGVHIVPGVVQAARLRSWWVPEPGTGVVTATVNGASSVPIAIDIPDGGDR